jgi:hypothetical protein
MTERVNTTEAEAVASLIRAASAGGSLDGAAREVLRGLVRATRNVSGRAGDTITSGAALVVRTAAESGGDIAMAAHAAVEGAIQGAREVGLDAAEAASTAALGAIEAAGDIGGTALEQVQSAATGTIDGVKVVPKVPFD